MSSKRRTVAWPPIGRGFCNSDEPVSYSPWLGRTLGISLALLVSVFCLLPSSSAQEIRDGVPYVQNGDIPSEGRDTIALTALWRVNGSQGDGPGFGRIQQACAGPDGSIYLLEPTVGAHVYSTEGKYLKTLRLQEPGTEVYYPALRLISLPDGSPGVLTATGPSILKWSANGTRERGAYHAIDIGGCGEMLFLFDGESRGGRTVLAGVATALLGGDHERRTAVLSRLNAHGNEEVRYYQGDEEIWWSVFRFSEREEYFPAPGRWTLGSDGRVYLAPLRDQYEIHVLAESGKLERVIRRDFQAPRRSAARTALYRAAADAAVKRNGQGAIEVCDTEPAVTRIRVEDDGTLWILHAASAYQQPDGVLQIYDVFDPEGHFIKQVEIVCEGDGENDALFWLGADRVLRVTGALEPGLVVPRGSPPAFGREAVPAEVVCYQVTS